MKRLLYVGNLTHSVDAAVLQGWFNRYGNVLCATVIADRRTRQCKGFGFVEMETDDQACSAILGLNAHEHDGQRVTIERAMTRVAPPSVVRSVGVVVRESDRVDGVAGISESLPGPSHLA